MMMNRLAKTGILLLTAILMAACSGDNEKCTRAGADANR